MHNNSNAVMFVLRFCSGSTVNVVVTLEREDEVTGPVIAPFFPQVTSDLTCMTIYIYSLLG